jgi:bifunctional non-homologous end joining protein LigD
LIRGAFGPRRFSFLVYLDFLQNRRGQTIGAPYSVRPYPGTTVATPLRWREVKRGLDPSKFTMATMPKRLDKGGDLWKLALGTGIDMEDSLRRLEGMKNHKDPWHLICFEVRGRKSSF